MVCKSDPGTYLNHLDLSLIVKRTIRRQLSQLPYPLSSTTLPPSFFQLRLLLPISLLPYLQLPLSRLSPVYPLACSDTPFSRERAEKTEEQREARIRRERERRWDSFQWMLGLLETFAFYHPCSVSDFELAITTPADNEPVALLIRSPQLQRHHLQPSSQPSPTGRRSSSPVSDQRLAVKNIDRAVLCSAFGGSRPLRPRFHE